MFFEKAPVVSGVPSSLSCSKEKGGAAVQVHSAFHRSMINVRKGRFTPNPQSSLVSLLVLPSALFSNGLAVGSNMFSQPCSAEALEVNLPSPRCPVRPSSSMDRFSEPAYRALAQRLLTNIQQGAAPLVANML